MYTKYGEIRRKNEKKKLKENLVPVVRIVTGYD